MLQRYAPRGSFQRQLINYGAAHAGNYIRTRGTRILQRVMARDRGRRRGRTMRGAGRRRRVRAGKGFGVQRMQGIGPRRTTKLFKLCHVFNLAGDATNRTVDKVITISDPTDSEAASGADQPTGWEEWSAFYDHAKVISCWADLKFTNVSTAHESLVIGLLADTTSTTLTGVPLVWTTWCGFPRTQHRHLQTVDLDAGTGAESKTIRMRYGCKPYKVHNQTFKNQRFEITCPDTAATDQVFLHILLSGWNEGIPPVTTIVECTIVMHWKVQFYDRKNLAKGTDS